MKLLSIEVAKIASYATILIIYCSTSAAADSCEQVFHPVKFNQNTSNDLLFLSPKTCLAKRIVTPNYSCGITIGYQHGAKFLRCGNSLVGSWITRSISDERSYFGTVGYGKKARVPGKDELKRAYDEGRDTDASLPIATDDLPMEFTDVGIKIHVDNPDFKSFIQIIAYKTFTSESRIAVAGEAAIGCQKIQFSTWTTPETLWQRSKDMGSFIADLRMEDVENPRAAFSEARIPPTAVNGTACAPENAN